MRKGRVDLIKLVCDRAGVPECLVAAKTVRLSTQASQTQRQGGDAASPSNGQSNTAHNIALRFHLGLGHVLYAMYRLTV